jgi:hypothetical protein
MTSSENQLVVQRVTGLTGDGAPAEIMYAGVWEGLRYVWQYVESNFLNTVNNRQTETLSTLDGEAVLASFSGDLLVMVADVSTVRALQRPSDVSALSRIHQVVPTNVPFDAVAKTMSRREVKRGETLAREGYAYDVSTRDEDFYFFYRSMHQPTMCARYGEAARSVEESEAYETLFKKGVLFRVFCRDIWVAGSVSQLDVAQGTLNARLIGVRHGDDGYRLNGAQNYVYHAILDWACKEDSIQRVDFQGCEPFLTKGTLQYKKRFGAHAVIPSNIFQNLRILIRPKFERPSVRSFLVNHPILVEGTDGRIEATYFFDEEMPARNDIPYECPGITVANYVSLDTMRTSAQRRL